MLYIFDLDYTLLDTTLLKKCLAAALELEVIEFLQQEKKWFVVMGRHYNPNVHLELLIDEGLIDQRKADLLKIKLNNFLLAIDECLFEGVEDLLSELKKRGDKLVLISKGDAEWQKMKINGSKILKQYFDDILIEENDKTEHPYMRSLASLCSKVTIVNDKPAEGLKMKQFLESLNLSCHLIMIKGPYTSKDDGFTELGVECADDFSDLARSVLRPRAEKPISNEFKIH